MPGGRSPPKHGWVEHALYSSVDWAYGPAFTVFLDVILNGGPTITITSPPRWRKHTMSTIVLPDGTQADAHSVICGGCGKPVDEHDCDDGTTKTRVSKPRAKPEDKPPCPHCGGAFHFSMPGGLQNTECIMRQFYLDAGTIKTPYERLPVFTIGDLKAAVEWADDLKAPITYGRMESAAGGSGTWSSIRKASMPAAVGGSGSGKRTKKIRPAKAGEKIEDLAASVTPVKTKGKKSSRAATAAVAEPATPAPSSGKVLKRRGTPISPAVPTAPTPIAEAPTASKRRASKTAEATPATPSADAEAAERRARRRALLSGRAAS